MESRSDKSGAERDRRAHAAAPVRLFEGEARVLEGVTRDISASGFSAFLKRVTDGVVRGMVDFTALTPAEMKMGLAAKRLSAVLDVAAPVGPVGVEVVRAENSWRPEYEMFVAFRFLSVNSAEREALVRFAGPEKEPHAGAGAGGRGEGGVGTGGDADVINIVFPARNFYLGHMRLLCRRLAADGGFAGKDAERIEACFGEVLMNAFKHGCVRYGRDRIEVAVSFDDEGMFVSVRDPAGKKFDYSKYREFDKRNPESSRTGLHLVDKFADGWSVDTKPGKYTQVSFFKNRTRKGGG